MELGRESPKHQDRQHREAEEVWEGLGSVRGAEEQAQGPQGRLEALES